MAAVSFLLAVFMSGCFHYTPTPQTRSSVMIGVCERARARTVYFRKYSSRWLACDTCEKSVLFEKETFPQNGLYFRVTCVKLLLLGEAGGLPKTKEKGWGLLQAIEVIHS